MAELNFKDKVVVVTGAGGGLGKHYCLEFAKRGAKVVVNDLGGSLSGEGGNSRAADVVVNEIKSAGGVAVADYNNVLDGEKIIDTAVKSFGTVHVVINNAGILRDASFRKMGDKEFNLVLDVHTNGAYKVTKAAWPIFRDQKFGRIINTASPAGLYGNFGQANYSAAKLALVSLAETLSKEGAKYNIVANTIAPLAKSRMTETVLPPPILEQLSPEKVAPLVMFLTHESNTLSGQIFEVAAGFFAQIRWERSGGTLFKPGETFTAEAVAKRFEEILDFDDSNKPDILKTQHPTMLNDYNALIEAANQLPPNDLLGAPEVSLKDKVVLITGAGSGLGRVYALWFAKYGAKVVVNDFKDPDSVVQEIKAKGGEAHGDKNNVVDAEAVMDNVIKKYGTIDVLVNNAGLLRDKSFLKMTDDEWFLVQKIHLIATFRLTKLAWEHFYNKKYGRIINISSTSGIYGNFGQANYSAAKGAVLGLSRTLAIEGSRSNIKVNIVAPHAMTAMTQGLLGENAESLFPPEHVAPLLVFLASENVPVTGELFEAGAGWIGNTRWQRAKGAVDKGASPEFVRDHLKDITDFSTGTENPKSTTESSMAILSAVSGGDDDEEEEEEEEDDDDEPKVDGKNFVMSYNDRDVILYNIGVGATSDQLQYVYENDSDFQVVPSFGHLSIFGHPDAGSFDSVLKNFNPMFLLHGEHYIKIQKYPIPTEASYKTEFNVLSAIQKGSNSVVVQSAQSKDAKTGEPLFYNEGTFFIRKCECENKQYQQRNKFATETFAAPQSDPEYVTEVKIGKDQAALYRLSGDRNPLHIDPGFAQGAGFERPILHGMCTYGLSVKALLDKFGPIEEMKARFSGIVFPGETLKISAWKKGDVVIYQVHTVERKTAVITNAAVKLVSEKSKI